MDTPPTKRIVGLSVELVRQIWELRAQGWGAKSIADRLGVKKNNVQGVISGRSWRHVRLAGKDA
jgi:hypothetical protein